MPSADDHALKPVPSSPLPQIVARLQRLGGWKRSTLLVTGDVLATTVSYYVAFLLRFEGHLPPGRLEQYAASLPILILIRVGVNLASNLHRWSFRLSGLHEALRVVRATLLGTALFATAFYFAQRARLDISMGPPRSIIVIEWLLTTTVLIAGRFSVRVSAAWGLPVFRPRPEGWVRTIIAGAGSAGELLLRDLERSDEHNYAVLGFVDDSPSKRGATLGGRQVLGSLDDLPAVCRRWRIDQVLFAIPRLAPERLRGVLAECADLKLTYRIIPVSYAFLNDRQTSSRLQELAPEDLLSRHPVRFDRADIEPYVTGRRVLVTGAAGSIGSEICRQVAEANPSTLVLLDIAESGLYLLYRDLKLAHPSLEVVPQVVDIRDENRLKQLGVERRPQIILHAAAHKHVPLMEWNPEEAVKNNVFGCRNALGMADAAGAERFVLVSTDKAVEPSSVMGATKQLAEMLVRLHARRSSTRCTVVRFGNVLGSAGSVVPLFKEQIAHGGPVTVTHPECRRFLMTIREAVGLTLLAGLGSDHDLFVLDMGPPIRILDLARLMITLAGRVPDKEIRLVFTGLRPGEKLSEKLMTEAEAETARPFGDGVFAVTGDRPRDGFARRLDALSEAAAGCDRERIAALLSEMVAGYSGAAAPALASEPRSQADGIIAANVDG
jgi:FlaA1/EpsC-like NDP-sugar epimerase